MNRHYPILTISIPTYNRAYYLNRCLLSIENQLKPETPILIKIYDNCSTDNTKNIVEPFILRNENFIYQKNEQNIGPDLNIGQCYYTSDTKYTLVFGDDDVFLDGTLDYLIAILNRNTEFGLVFLNFYLFKKDHFQERPNHIKKLNDAFILNGTSIVKITAYQLGFISACVVNTKAINKERIIENAGSNFNQLFPILSSVKLCYPNLYIRRYCIAQQAGNSTGFDYFRIFADNFYKIAIKILGPEDKSISWIKTDLLTNVLPTAILLARNKKHANSYIIGSSNIIRKNFHSTIKYWIFDYPLLKLPYFLAYLLRIIIVIFIRIYYKIVKKMFFMDKKKFFIDYLNL
jgi:abequosyltransferase